MIKASFNKLCLILFFTVFGSRVEVDCSKLDIKELLGNEPLTKKRIAEDIIAYFQRDHPSGIPVLDIPDKLDVGGPFKTTLMTLDEVSITGHSKATLEYVDINLDKLQFQVRLNFPALEVLGVYEWSGWWTSSEGDMNITFVDLSVGAVCDFGINDEGIVEAVDMQAILEKEQFIPTFTGLSTQHSLIIYAADTFFDSTVLPLIQNAIKDKGMSAINKRLQDRLKDKRFPVDISPVDFVIAKMRSDIAKKRGLDPVKIEKREMKVLGLSIVLKNISFEGLSTIHRSDVIRTEFVDNRIYVTIEIGTQQLRGRFDWFVYSTLFPIGSGHTYFSLDGLKISVEVQQEADIRHPPILRKIDIELGNVALRSTGERNLDYILEAAVNVIPNALRNSILDKRIESRLKQIIQSRFNKLNLERIVRDRISKLQDK